MLQKNFLEQLIHVLESYVRFVQYHIDLRISLSQIVVMSRDAQIEPCVHGHNQDMNALHVSLVHFKESVLTSFIE